MKSIIFMGTPQFAAPILKSLIQNPEYKVEAVVTQPDRRTGRKHKMTMSPVKKVAVDNDIPVFQPEKLSGSQEMAQLIAFNADLIVTAAFGQFLPMKLINSVKIAAVNVHGSLLPKYRGGAPVQYAIMNGESETGITIIYMVKKMDAGKMLAQRKINIENTDDVGSMFEKLSIVGRNLLNDTLPKLIAGELTGVEQDETQVTFAPNIKPEEEQIDFSKSAKLVDAKVRALRPFPVGYVILNGVRTKLWSLTPLKQKTDLLPGQVVEKTKHELLIATGDKGVVRLDRVQPAGKPQMEITDYLNGSQEAFYEGEQVIKL
ncbi:methionyl-tRNA formyltransferase [Pediococcus ethanolidurans]|uniref:methionyl-tRNA formyltransferase n=1 Tax=Pediococcus ethanolidurans TaxID=319653 RepID=UPI001C1EDFF2|nr:methionyl-tRNA formyltransferase [Pediococcus ethanolidurans]MBU7554516.1 methionyl-tRNA formyltransferase [Pediococcus ethanolidurans]MCT4397187.1 methionyl-tRNA formyltransferase [Pediococcus ethanolidurans]MCV3315091.1 methionyl-tRNA formyltransferase [Pediococcus ethanolidurans]MCV3320851.1 methionyl-tRNA formyltransferase [Pediococcus ethanolidurans]MCV3323516.1 methionyl-tRNA formyltransferase [Pediococcus ethanolidurans]